MNVSRYLLVNRDTNETLWGFLSRPTHDKHSGAARMENLNELLDSLPDDEQPPVGNYSLLSVINDPVTGEFVFRHRLSSFVITTVD